MPYAVQTFGQPPRGLPRCDGISNFRAVHRKLWTDCAIWTHQYVVSALADLPDAQDALQRLVANQDEIGRSVIGFLGPANSLKLTKLFRERTTVLGRLVVAAKTDDAEKAATARENWKTNATAIATLLNSANSRWTAKTVTETLQHHLDLIVKGITARLDKDWAGDITAFDACLDHLMKFSDLLSNGMLAMVEAVAARRK
jgi:hypothetical protein